MKREPIKSEVFSFRTSDEKTIKALHGQNQSDIVGKIISDYYNGELIPKEEALMTKELNELKYRDYRARIIKKEFLAKLAMMRSGESPQDVADIMNEKKDIFEVNATKDIIQMNRCLRCSTCGKILLMRAHTYQQVEDYETHVKINHDRELMQNEKDKMLELMGEIVKHD